MDDARHLTRIDLLASDYERLEQPLTRRIYRSVPDEFHELRRFRLLGIELWSDAVFAENPSETILGDGQAVA